MGVIREDIDWSKMQKEHDSGRHIKELMRIYGISRTCFNTARKYGLFILRNLHKVVSEETRKKISESRKIFIALCPENVPYVMNHHSKKTYYPEAYFIDCLRDSKFQHRYRYSTYELDFADLENKIDLEIDGNQHLSSRMMAHDTKRNQFMLDNGWQVIRVLWSRFCGLDKIEKERIVACIIRNKNPKANCVLWIDKISISHEPYENKQKYKICVCGKQILGKSISCKRCRNVSVTNPNKPTLQEIEKSLEGMSKSAFGRKYGVTHTTINRWIKQYGEGRL